MRRRRGALLAVAAASALGTAPWAQAAPAPSCPTMTEPAGDPGPGVDPGNNGAQDTTPGARALDLRSADLGSVRNALVVTMTLKDLSDREPVYEGHSYTVGFQTETTRYELTADLSPDGNDYYLTDGPAGSSVRSTVGPVKGAVDVAGNRIRMTVPLAVLRSIGAEGRVTGLQATAGRQVQNVAASTPSVYVGHGGVILVEDTLSTATSYRLGGRGCG